MFYFWRRIIFFLNLQKIFVLFFQVMIQAHNLRMSFSLYISALAVTDTICLLIGE